MKKMIQQPINLLDLIYDIINHLGYGSEVRKI